jgi:hypothetical protein
MSKLLFDLLNVSFPGRTTVMGRPSPDHRFKPEAEADQTTAIKIMTTIAVMAT